jgi:hypothetical protein
MRGLADFQGAVQVAQVVLIADHRVVTPGGPATPKPGTGAEIQPPALSISCGVFVLPVLIVVDVTKLQHRLAVAGQITALHFGEQSPAMNVLGIERGIVMGSQIQIIR